VPSLIYRIRVPEPHTHLVAVELEAADVHEPASLVMPSWTPGSYLMREFARNVVQFEAADGAWRPIPFHKTDKGTWRVDAPPDGVLRARWIVSADELTVRTSHVDASHAYLNGASVLMYLDGRQHQPAEVEVFPPEGWWITTPLQALGETRFRAAGFDELVDSPFEIGQHHRVEWEVDGITHRYAIWGRGNVDPRRLVEDTTRIIRAERAMFGVLPYPVFTFFLHLTGGGGGGLEHRSSTSLLADRWSFRGPLYENFLGLVAHELFHVWNGKRIRPAALGPFDYTRENYTRDLWVVEGITTYYTDLLLRRAGILTQERYLAKLGEMISRFQTLPGRAVQPLADSSFDTWIKFYRPDANTPNATISYYQKGALVAMLLDLRIRAATENARSLDDVMRVLWERFGARDEGFPEGAVEGVAEEVAGVPLRGFFDHALRSTGELDYADFAAAGLMLVPMHPPPAPPPAAAGAAAGPSPDPSAAPAAGQPGSPPAAGGAAAAGAGGARGPMESRTGLQLRMEGPRIVVAHVLAGSAAWRAGVNAGDELVAMDGFRVPAPDWLNARIVERPAGSRVALTLFRRDELLNLALQVETGPPQQLVLKRVENPSAAQQAVLADWLRTDVPDPQAPGASAPPSPPPAAPNP
jgi:predicted metalloprotease with PDZ domain